MTGPLANCAHQPCGQCFTVNQAARYCSVECRDAEARARARVKWRAKQASKPPKVHRCVECDLTFDTSRQLGGHTTSFHVRPRYPTPVAAPSKPAAKANPRRLTGTVTTVTVHKTMTFACDCGATYTDSNRFDHHRRVTHDAPMALPAEVQVSRPYYATRLA